MNKLKNLKNKISLADVVFGLIIFLTILISGLLNMFTYGFDATELISISFWLAILIKCLANGLVLYSSATNKISHVEKENEQIIYLKSSLELAVKQDIKEDFVTFLAEINEKEKIKTYKLKIKRKIFKLDKHASHRQLNKWKLYEEEKKIVPNIDAHDYGRYVYKRQKLLDKMEDSYIAKNINTIKIKYYYLTRNMIISNLKSDDERAYYIVDKNKKVSKDLLPRLSYTVAFTLIISSIILDPNFENLNAIFWLNFITNVFTLVFSFFTGSNYGKEFAETVVIANYYTKKQIIDDYKIWKKRGA